MCEGRGGRHFVPKHSDTTGEIGPNFPTGLEVNLWFSTVNDGRPRRTPKPCMLYCKLILSASGSHTRTAKNNDYEIISMFLALNIVLLPSQVTIQIVKAAFRL